MKPNNAERSRKTRCRIRQQIKNAKATGYEIVLGVSRVAADKIVIGPAVEIVAPTRGEQKKVK